MSKKKKIFGVKFKTIEVAIHLVIIAKTCQKAGDKLVNSEIKSPRLNMP